MEIWDLFISQIELDGLQFKVEDLMIIFIIIEFYYFLCWHIIIILYCAHWRIGGGQTDKYTNGQGDNILTKKNCLTLPQDYGKFR